MRLLPLRHCRHQQVAVFLADDIIRLGPQVAQSWAAIGSTDPIFEVIEGHKKVNAELDEAIKVLVPGTVSPDPATEKLYGTREYEARWDLATTVPTTLVGQLAVLEYVEGVHKGEFSPSGRPDYAFDEEDMRNFLISAQDCLNAHLNPSTNS